MNTFHFNINDGYYLFRRNKWMIDPAFYLKTYASVKIDRPIFLVGNQGDGLTLVSRILRRHKSVVNVTGNANYWAGADEMQRVFNEFLPMELCYNHRSLKPLPNNLSLQKGWLYASNDQLDVFRSTSADSSPELAGKLRHVMQYCLHRHRITDSSRFIDKSQIYSVKVGLLNDLLFRNSPHFVYITRNPYASIYRMALLSNKNYGASFSHALKIHKQHWINSFLAIKEDRNNCNHFYQVKFEDILLDVGPQVEKLITFLDLPFTSSILPKPDDKIPFGSKAIDRWHPLKPEINDKYLTTMPSEVYNDIHSDIGSFAKELGY